MCHLHGRAGGVALRGANAPLLQMVPAPGPPCPVLWDACPSSRAVKTSYESATATGASWVCALWVSKPDVWGLICQVRVLEAGAPSAGATPLGSPFPPDCRPLSPGGVCFPASPTCLGAGGVLVWFWGFFSSFVVCVGLIPLVWGLFSPDKIVLHVAMDTACPSVGRGEFRVGLHHRWGLDFYRSCPHGPPGCGERQHFLPPSYHSDSGPLWGLRVLQESPQT